MVELFNEENNKASYWDILKWITEKYPEDVFLMENPMFLEIRDRARILLNKKVDHIKDKNKSREDWEKDF